MVRVTVELLSTRTGKTSHLGTAFITNDGTGTNTVGCYQAMFSKRGDERAPWKYGAVENFPRNRLGAWDLLYRALKSAVGSRNP